MVPVISPGYTTSGEKYPNAVVTPAFLQNGGSGSSHLAGAIVNPNVNAVDDKQATRSFDLITQEIKDFVGNYFDPRYQKTGTTITPNNGTGSKTGTPTRPSQEFISASLPNEIRDIWKDIAPGIISVEEAEEIFAYNPTSQSSSSSNVTRTRLLLIRAIAWGLIQKAWISGDLIGCPAVGVHNNTPTPPPGRLDPPGQRSSRNSHHDQQYQQLQESYRLRREAYSNYVNNPMMYTPTRQATITQSLTAWIDTLLVGLTSSSSNTASHHSALTDERRSALSAIIDRAATLCASLGVQVAEFRFVGAGIGGLWDEGLMEDIDGLVSSGNSPSSPSSSGKQGLKVVRIVVAPGLVKWGNAQGENWGQRLVLTRAKVVVNVS